MTTEQTGEVRRWAEALRQAEHLYWDLVARYVVLTEAEPGGPRKRPARVLDLTAVREFEAAESARRKAADTFHAMLRRRSRAMDE